MVGPAGLEPATRVL